MLRLKTLINVFDSCSSGVSAETRESPEDSLYSLSNKRLRHSTVSDKLSMVMGVPTLVCEYSECFKKLATVCSDWDFQHMPCSHLKF